MGQASPQTLVLDAGALIAFERADPRMRSLLREALKKHAKLVIPAGVVAQVVRHRARQVSLYSLLNSDISVVQPLDRTLAEACGELCARARTTDVVDASVVLVARREQAKVLTSDVGDLRKLDPSVHLVPI